MINWLKYDYTVEFWMFTHRLVKKLRLNEPSTMGHILGLSRSPAEQEMVEKATAMMKTFETVYNSMTVQERRKTHQLNGRRRWRIAKGAGIDYNTTSLILDTFDKMRYLKF